MKDATISDRVYTILIQETGASPEDRFSFRNWFENQEGFEYRFQGALGFGGKFWRNNGRFYVTCYRENETPERLAVIEKTNAALAAIDSSR